MVIFYLLIIKDTIAYLYTQVNQKFFNILVTWDNLTAPEDFAKVVKVTRLWNVKLAWYSPGATFKIYLNGLEQHFWFHGFKPTRPSLIVL